MMIMFLDDVNLVNYIEDDPNNIVIFNLSSYYSSYNDISTLLTNISPLNNTGLPINEFVYSPSFDEQYMQTLFSNEDMFTIFMKLIAFAYEGYTVVVLVSRDEYRDAVMESIIKIIQERYGFLCWIVYDAEDLRSIEDTSPSTGGLITLDNDLARYTDLCFNKGYVYALPMVNTEYN